MSELAEDMVDGTICSLCNMTFVGPRKRILFTHGYPVACKKCWSTMDRVARKKSGLQRALVDTFKDYERCN